MFFLFFQKINKMMHVTYLIQTTHFTDLSSLTLPFYSCITSGQPGPRPLGEE